MSIKYFPIFNKMLVLLLLSCRSSLYILITILFFKILFIDVLKYIFYRLCYYSCPIFPPYSPLPCTPPPTHIPSLNSSPWVIHISYLPSPFPILFLTSPCLFYIYHLCLLFPVLFPPFSPSHQ